MKASKFRFIVWDNEDKEFVTNVQEDRVPTRNTKKGFRLKSKFEFFMTTGFKDSKKNEIYDGHVLRVYDKPLDLSKSTITTVQYMNGRFKFSAPINQNEFFHKTLSFWKRMKVKYEIIGHIKITKKQ